VSAPPGAYVDFVVEDMTTGAMNAIPGVWVRSALKP
jgi:hypothetical protein